ncbi:glutathione S-transferase family protein [Paracoccus pantotrophus]|uniref:glutathione S-transferase family protein n=1 Tax=Paracoccus pantotrophus TaxID=82367 RepID=UPI00046551EB|nr:glutathione S-transferase family protein [Paracoccus pantotrophus]
MQTCTLYYAAPSPFVRKVRVVAQEVGQVLELAPVFASPVAPSAELLGANPLGKIPALRISSGEVLYDSAVICRYLGHGTTMYPEGAGLWRALRREALADGLIEAALLARYEVTLRPEEFRWGDWIDGQMEKVARALIAMSEDGGNPDNPDIGDIATGCALAYLDFRYPQLGWREDFPELASFADVMNERGAFHATRPE